jgi:hypothetical protein
MDSSSIIIILAAALAVSEALALNPKWKSNSLLQAITELAKALKVGLEKKEEEKPEEKK